MPTTKRAWLYVKRNRKRTALLFVLLTVLLAVSLAGLALHAASTEAVRLLRESIGGYCTIHTGADGREKTDEALLAQLKTLDHIRGYNGVDTYYLYAEGLALVPACWHGSGTVDEFTPRLIGCTDSSLHERFVSSSFQLVEGSPIGPDDHGKALISKDVAALNGLTVGDTVRADARPGVHDWPDGTAGVQVEYEIAGIYAATRSEPVQPATPERDLQENIIFTDIQTAKELAAVKFPQRAAGEYVYSSGIMLFVDDPAKMEETVAYLRQQSFADWDSLLVFENSAAYQQAAAPIRKASAISLFLLVVILAVSVVILSLTLLLWTRERVTEIGILIAIGVPSKGIFLQMLLETGLTAIPAFAASLLLGAVLCGGIGGAVGGALGPVRLGAAQAAAVLGCAAVVIFLTVLIAAVSILRKKPREILADLS